MGYARTETIAVTTAADGSATVYSAETYRGPIVSLAYVKDDFDNGSTFTITGEATGVGVWTETGVNASASRSPHLAVHDQVGGAALYAAAGEAVLGMPVHLVNERLKIVIASGGNAKSGSFVLTVG